MTDPDDATYLDYHVRWRPGGARPGRHAAGQGGSGGDFVQYRPFWQLPDARRIDIKRSALDPSGEVIVRQTRQRGVINIVLATDLSRSMQPAPDRPGLGCVAMLAEAAARSALRAGDAFGLVGFDGDLRDDVWLPPTRSRGAARHAISQLARLPPKRPGAAGIARLAERLPPGRCLVLLVSDFLMPPGLVERALTALARHDVAPVMLELDPPEMLPPLGLLRLADAETGRTRLVLMRPALRRRWLAAAAARRRQLDLLFLRHCRPAFHARASTPGGMDLQALSDHLAGA